jgi:hypothetical protein
MPRSRCDRPQAALAAHAHGSAVPAAAACPSCPARQRSRRRHRRRRHRRSSTYAAAMSLPNHGTACQRMCCRWGRERSQATKAATLPRAAKEVAPGGRPRGPQQRRPTGRRPRRQALHAPAAARAPAPAPRAPPARRPSCPTSAPQTSSRRASHAATGGSHLAPAYPSSGCPWASSQRAAPPRRCGARPRRCRACGGCGYGTPMAGVTRCR